jgi:hypothetical protein
VESPIAMLKKVISYAEGWLDDGTTELRQIEHGAICLWSVCNRKQPPALPEKLSAEQTANNTQSDEIIAGIAAYINGRLDDNHITYHEKQWCLTIRSLYGNRQ